ncbi:nitrous oxide reductase family maturation protein NosD [Ferruginibacter sp. SUN002]|uniref:nitrous oxide reductase family maturation protein NosD n=1 Tax=Ferruginibacter sp. SUN002 TaxID=2937789 RepID=UPI003D3607BE
MKKYFFILAFLGAAVAAQAKTIRVGKQHAIKTIQQALLLSTDGDSVLVDAGIYKEKNINITKKISFIGLGQPVIDGQNKYEVISVKANGVIVDGFKIIHSGISSIEDFAGIKIYNSREVIIRNNILDDTFFGIYAQYATNCIIEKNTLTAYSKQEQESGNGIHCWKSDSMKIIANTVSGHRDGIYFEFVTHSIIWRNTSFSNIRYGLHFMFSNNDTYITNIFRANGAGVAVMFSNHVKMFHNYFEENWGDAAYGLLLKEISDSYIENNYFTKNTTGIHMEGASRINMEKNVFENNGWALKIQASCMDIALTASNFINNTFDVGTNGSLVLNTFNKNYWDKYDGYDLDKDKIGDVPYRPVSMYSVIVEQNPTAMMLFRSLMAALLDKTEKVLPTLTPENLIDDFPLMKPLPL